MFYWAKSSVFPIGIIQEFSNESFKNTAEQSHYIEDAQGDIFMEQKIRLGPVDNTENKLG
jgi:hypothetical protein